MSHHDAVQYVSAHQSEEAFAVILDDMTVAIYSSKDGEQIGTVNCNAVICEILPSRKICAVVEASNPTDVAFLHSENGTTTGKIKLSSLILGVKISSDYVYCVLRNKVVVYFLHDLSLKMEIETGNNPSGLIALCKLPGRNALLVPTKQAHHLTFISFVGEEVKPVNISFSIENVGAAALSEDGNFTAALIDSHGDNIELIDCLSNESLGQFPAMKENITKMSISFSPCSEYVAVISSRGTLLIYLVSDFRHRAVMDAGCCIANTADGGLSDILCGINAGGNTSEDQTFAGLNCFAFSHQIIRKAGKAVFFSKIGDYVIAISSSGIFYKFEYSNGEECVLIMKSKFVIPM